VKKFKNGSCPKQSKLKKRKRDKTIATTTTTPPMEGKKKRKPSRIPSRQVQIDYDEKKLLLLTENGGKVADTARTRVLQR
jgi:hypothetical protein